jgi:hypothetical protein
MPFWLCVPTDGAAFLSTLADIVGIAAFFIAVS